MNRTPIAIRKPNVPLGDAKIWLANCDIFATFAFPVP
jgi:hypothetical protein